MNLELLDPFGRQVPDRVDATLQLPESIEKPKGADGDDDEDWKTAYHVAFNRRGMYIAVGHASGIVAVYDTLSRTLVALYPPLEAETTKAGEEEEEEEKEQINNGCSSVSWSRRSRTLLAGATGDTIVRLYDTSHPFGPEESGPQFEADDAAAAATSEEQTAEEGVSKPLDEIIPPPHRYDQTRMSSFADPDRRHVFVKTSRGVPTRMLESSRVVAESSEAMDTDDDDEPKKKYPCVYFDFPSPVAGSLQINPKRPTSGLAVLSDGSLVLFSVPETAFVEGCKATADLVKLCDGDESVTCAAFDPHGDRIYAATRDGTLMGFTVANVWRALLTTADDDDDEERRPMMIPNCKPKFTISASEGSATVWHLLVSRNGKFLILNSADGAIRLYSTQDCWEKPEFIEKPIYVFQDVVTKVKFASCDLSGDGEYVVGGSNGGADDKYELYMWNTSTGALMDKLTGASTRLYSVAWHPTRSFLAVACADGLVDIWGPRINWTAFAPDFQALPMNVEYIEREDEFDVDENGNHLAAADQDGQNKSGDDENAIVDVTTIEPVPVFASDSEDEEEVFAFETRVKNLLAGRGKGASKPTAGEE